MSNTRKQVAFDLDTNALKTYYPTKSWNNAYDLIKRHMLENGFNWLQGSVYVSRQPMLSADVTKVLYELVKNNEWLNVCMRDCRETNIGKEYSKNYLFDKDMEILPREDVVFKRQKTEEFEF